MSLSVPALATGKDYTKEPNSSDLLEASFQLNGDTISYKYMEENGEIIYAEVGNDVIEKLKMKFL